MHYRDIAPTLDTGDLLLVRGPSRVSHEIEVVTRSPFSHVAMLLRRSDGFYLWQATSQKGVGTNPIEDLEHFPNPRFGTFVVRRLLVERTPAMREMLDEFVRATSGEPFAGDARMAVEWIEGLLGVEATESRFFCAQLVAESYMRMGLLPTYPYANAYAPKSFSTGGGPIPFLQGARLDDEIVVTFDDTGPEAPVPAPLGPGPAGGAGSRDVI